MIPRFCVVILDTLEKLYPPWYAKTDAPFLRIGESGGRHCPPAGRRYCVTAHRSGGAARGVGAFQRRLPYLGARGSLAMRKRTRLAPSLMMIGMRIALSPHAARAG